jgi:hypothetical protein
VRNTSKGHYPKFTVCRTPSNVASANILKCAFPSYQFLGVDKRLYNFIYRSHCFTDCKNNWDPQVWEDLVLEFLSATLTEMDEEKWTMGLGVKLMEQIPLCQSYPEERGMLYKCLAVTVCHTTDEQFINHQLDVMLSSMRHNSASESKVSPPQYDMFVGLPLNVDHKISLVHIIFKSQVMLHIF